MLTLFPAYYWFGLIGFALVRVITGQIFHYHLKTLQSDQKYKSIVDTVVSTQAKLFLRFNGVTHLLVVFGIMSMFYIMYEYVVPITYVSSTALQWVRVIGYMIIAVEVIGSAVSCILIAYLMKSK